MKDTKFERAMQANAAPLDEYLAGLIAKASPQWQGVDVDEFMDMVRGREPETFSKAVAGSNPDWDFVINGTTENDLVINLI